MNADLVIPFVFLAALTVYAIDALRWTKATQSQLRTEGASPSRTASGASSAPIPFSEIVRLCNADPTWRRLAYEHRAGLWVLARTRDAGEFEVLRRFVDDVGEGARQRSRELADAKARGLRA